MSSSDDAVVERIEHDAAEEKPGLARTHPRQVRPLSWTIIPAWRPRSKAWASPYYKDLQEDKEPLFDSLEQIGTVIEVFTGVLATLSVKADAIESRLDPLLFATDVADYLVAKGAPFRRAHKIVGALVSHSIDTGTAFAEMPLATFKTFSPLFGEDVKKLFSWKQALAHRDVAGGTGEKSVARQIAEARRIIKRDLT